MIKQSRARHTKNSLVASPTMSGSITIEQCKKEEEHEQFMAHLRTQMDFLTKHLLSGKIEKVKTIASQGSVDFDSEKKANYLNNQGGFQASSQGN